MIYHILFVSLFFVQSYCQEGSCPPSDPRCTKEKRELLFQEWPIPNERSIRPIHQMTDEDGIELKIGEKFFTCTENKEKKKLTPEEDFTLPWPRDRKIISKTDQSMKAKNKMEDFRPLPIVRPESESRISPLRRLEELQNHINDLINSSRGRVSNKI